MIVLPFNGLLEPTRQCVRRVTIVEQHRETKTTGLQRPAKIAAFGRSDTGLRVGVVRRVSSGCISTVCGTADHHAGL